MKNKAFIFIAIITLASVIFGTNGIANALELEYPELPGGRKITDKTTLPELIAYIYVFALVVIGFVALGALIYAGFLWMTSVGKPSVQQDAKDQIVKVIIGIIILFGSYILLNTLNPDLLRLKASLIPIPEYQFAQYPEFCPSNPEQKSPNPNPPTLCRDLEDCGIPARFRQNCCPMPRTRSCSDGMGGLGIPPGCPLEVDGEMCLIPSIW